MRIIVTGGGTGGHIYPAIAIADKIKEKVKDAEILYVGNDIGLEKDIVPKTGYPMEMVSAMWIDRSNALKIFRTGTKNLQGIAQSGKIMKKFKPDAVIGTGGYVCFPVIYAAHRYGAKCYLHEQNAYPGMANRQLEKFVNKVFLGFSEASEYFHEPAKHVTSGNPVRSKFYDVDRKKARENLGLPEDHFIIFSFGGSQGAEKINEVMYPIMKELNGKGKITLLFATGSQYYDEIIEKAIGEKLSLASNIRIEPYIDKMEDYLGACDLVVSRAGALSVAETCICGRASILIPSPNVTGNHQYFNAKSVADRGGAVIIEEKDLTIEKLVDEMAKLRSDMPGLREMEKCARSAVKDNAADVIADTIISEINHG